MFCNVCIVSVMMCIVCVVLFTCRPTMRVCVLCIVYCCRLAILCAVSVAVWLCVAIRFLFRVVFCDVLVCRVCGVLCVCCV